MKKAISLLIAAFMMAALFAGCGGEKKSAGTSIKGGGRTVTDMAGREVKIPAKPESAGSLSASARIMTYAGCADKIAGVTDLEKECSPAMPYAYVNRGLFSDLAAIATGGANDAIYEEALVELAPDVIFDDVTDPAEHDAMQEELGIPVIGLAYDGIFSESVYEAIELVADVMGTRKHASAVIKSMKGWQRDLEERTRDIPAGDKPSVYVGAVSYKGGHGIEGTYVKYPPFEAINAKNVADEAGGEGAILIDKEMLLKWDPDIIFLTPANMSYVNRDHAANPDLYDNLSAVRNGRLYSQVSYNYYGCNIELGIADAYYAGKVIYPERFADVDLAQKADEIFEVMIGRPYMDVLEESGNGFGPVKIGK